MEGADRREDREEGRRPRADDFRERCGVRVALWRREPGSLHYKAPASRDSQSSIRSRLGEGDGPPILITPPALQARHPAVSADGEWIAFDAEFGHHGSWSVGVVRKDGSGLRQVTDSGRRDLFPEWSPDGRRIAFFWSPLWWPLAACSGLDRQRRR